MVTPADKIRDIQRDLDVLLQSNVSMPAVERKQIQNRSAILNFFSCEIRAITVSGENSSLSGGHGRKKCKNAPRF